MIRKRLTLTLRSEQSPESLCSSLTWSLHLLPGFHVKLGHLTCLPKLRIWFQVGSIVRTPAVDLQPPRHQQLQPQPREPKWAGSLSASLVHRHSSMCLVPAHWPFLSFRVPINSTWTRVPAQTAESVQFSPAWFNDPHSRIFPCSLKGGQKRNRGEKNSLRASKY